MASTSETGPTGSAKSAKGGRPAEGKIDLQALAEKILQLLKEEARLEGERLGRPQAR
jgi:hypothetical protein